MKKIYITLAVLATAALSSCVQEKSFEGHVLEKGEVSFVLRAGAPTKASDMDRSVQKGVTVKIGEIGGQTAYLEETITDLSFIAPMTKGTPAFTENVGTLYENQLAVHTDYSDFVDATFETQGFENGGWRYFHRYENVPWPSNAVGFYMHMPAGAVDIPAEGYSGSSISFGYTSPTTAEAQEDLLFSYVSITEAEHNAQVGAGGYPVTFYHALTAVKFAIGNSATELSSKGISIDEVKFTGLVNTGTCSISFPAEGEPSVTWTASATTGNVISQDFSDVESLVEFNATNNPDFGSEFFANNASDKQNVNKTDASYTFWLIPQSFPSTSDAVLRISYTINNHNEYLDITLKDIIKTSNGTPIKWEAGQLRTFTVKLDEVNVKITDEVSISGNVDNGFQNSTKSNVRIQNTGDTDVFIRAAIVGQWLDSDNNPVFGFTDNVNNLYIVESWYEDQFVKTEAGTHGVFVGLPGYKGAATFKADGGSDATAGWQLCTDGYYYYTKIVAPEAYTGSNLFTSYTTTVVPSTIIAGEVISSSAMHFVLEVSTQAITAVKMDGHEGSRYTWKQAWKNATGIEPVEK